MLHHCHFDPGTLPILGPGGEGEADILVTDLSDSRWPLKLLPKAASHRGAGRPGVEAEPLTEQAKGYLRVPKPALWSRAWSQTDEPKWAVLVGATPASISGLVRAVLLGAFF